MFEKTGSMTVSGSSNVQIELPGPASDFSASFLDPAPTQYPSCNPIVHDEVDATQYRQYCPLTRKMRFWLAISWTVNESRQISWSAIGQPQS